MADLAAHGVFATVEPALLGSGEVAAMAGGVETFLTSDATILGAQIVRLSAADLALADLASDPVVLHGEAMVHLFAAGLMSCLT